ncbi:MAG TPA: MmcQ/YjbR family DNA-binding protein [Arsenicitalea sp.]|jgi:hypothetical protein|nr:MmcQ/YjbR family DNA-binding protein [Arsenicitalea sp.]
MTQQELVVLLMSFPEAAQSSHFGTTDFRIRNKIFATLPQPDRLMVKLTTEQQQVLVEAAGEVFSRVPNKWGERGATYAQISALDETTAHSAVRMAWANVAPKALLRSQLL